MDRAAKISFATQAYDEQDEVISMANKLSCLLVFGIEDKGSIDVRWGDKSCKVSYQFPTQNKELAYERQAVSCTHARMVVGAR
ncbi:FimD/PapC C-terminal domain-containing protein [Burkholderia ubonensis]|uniref:FimD/PapC C-terminal domain-containing protein n=1 Tax=Burkholderia ubonensis TaxID=101571 RepID=UPI000753787A|nr:FimD/PapC C-terminal domain-containing protein [Burkholderia ubonensis]AOI72397.1 hypothetical protein WI31_22650 [Burkholderia ubonensis]KUZ11884.1 hypothetical protein WI29_28810 [Burkholderia ubonensis]KUZ35682.1 hypothetical protein WI30_11310 [Burkholderia ubonensis]KUZ39209.1 hypothetical protein WI32_11350 [Burkholderia ubonensis]KUZ45671.1 hypothetical protein WI33_27090 [Burkholderia ubonensis]